MEVKERTDLQHHAARQLQSVIAEELSSFSDGEYADTS